MSCNQGMTVTPSGIPLSKSGVITASYIDNGPPKKADLVEVIRCKDCKRWKTQGCPMGVVKYPPVPDGFCHLGKRAERKEE